MKKLTILFSLLISLGISAQDTSRTTQVIPLSSLDTLIQSIVTVKQTVTSSYLEQSVRKYKPPVVNISPVAKAGTDITIQLPISSTSLSGSGTDADGTISGYSWSRVSGPTSFTFGNQFAASTTLTNLTAGIYTFRLTVSDNKGATGTDDVIVTVKTADIPTFPVGCNQNAPKTYIVGPTQPGEIYITNASGKGWKGGDTLKIMAGTYSVIEIDSFGGDPCRDIIVINSGGQVKAKTIRFQKDVHHVRVIGNGVSGLRYGIQTGVFAFNRVNHFTMKHIEIGPNPAGVGIYGKQDPYVNQPWTQYKAYTSTKITIDSNYVHDVDGEGMYIGHTYPGGDPANSNLVPQRQDSVTISNNIVTNCGWDGIQLSNARNGCLIYGNTVTNFGIKDIDGQRAGILSGGNTNSQVYNNTITNGMGNGIQFFGYGLMECYNNTITSVGKTLKTAGGEESIYGQANNHGPEVNPLQTMYIHDNQINYPSVRGIVRFNTTTSSGLIRFINNRICNAALANAIYLPTGSTVTGNTISCN